jgi:hypothetical protein
VIEGRVAIMRTEWQPDFQRSGNRARHLLTLTEAPRPTTFRWNLAVAHELWQFFRSTVHHLKRQLFGLCSGFLRADGLLKLAFPVLRLRTPKATR